MDINPIAGKVDQVDAEIRGAHAGKEIKDIEGPAGSAFAGIGLNLTPEQLYEYSKSVSESTAHDIELP
ncbi:MAG: hypothetical protein EOO67_16390 [Microbacterium sp.]|nr:MAG: hypothetical protein EOO67_16390 [Microbacterium sp.]